MSSLPVVRQKLAELPLWERMQESRRPLAFDLEITARCSNDCRHCYIRQPASDAGALARELSQDEIARIAGEAVSLGAIWCLVTGGEPLLRKDFADIYVMLKRLGLLVSVFTSACLVTPEHVGLFQSMPPRNLEVTVYGATRETYERVTRQPGSFAAFCRGLDLLLAGGVPLRLKAMVLKSNLHEMDQIARFCRARTKDRYRFDPLLHLRYDGDPARNAAIRAERVSPEEFVAVEQADAERVRALEGRGAAPVASQGERPAQGRLFPCAAGKATFTVGSDGTFRLCSALCQAGTICDLRDVPLAKAWGDLVPRVRQMTSNNRVFLEKCHACGLFELCGWCPAHAALETSHLDGWVEYFCQVAHARAEAFERQRHAPSCRS